MILILIIILTVIFLTQPYWCFFFVEFKPYATFDFHDLTVRPADNTGTDNSQTGNENLAAETGSSQYQNLSGDGAPIPGITRGIISYQPHYSNSQLLMSNERYSKLQVISAIAINWMRNTWGQVDQLGRHVYDILFFWPKSISHYDTSRTVALAKNLSSRTNIGAIDENGQQVYDHTEQPSVAAEVVVRQQKGNGVEGEISVCWQYVRHFKSPFVEFLVPHYKVLFIPVSHLIYWSKNLPVTSAQLPINMWDIWMI